MYSINVDWQEENNKWEFVGQNGYSEKQLENDPEIGIPMMNYAYPLEITLDEATIKKITKETNCTVVYNTDEDKQYLALTGGGMDLSQDIAKAYIITQGFIEWDFLDSVCLSQELSVGDLWFKKILKQAKEQYQTISERAKRSIEEIDRKLAIKAS